MPTANCLPKYTPQTIGLYESEINLEKKIRYLNDILFHFVAVDSQKWLEWYQKGIALIIPTGSEFGKYVLLDSLGVYHVYYGNLQEAILIFQECIEYWKGKHRWKRNVSLLNLSVAQANSGLYAEAIQTNLELIEYHRRHKEHYDLVFALVNIAVPYQALNMWKEYKAAVFEALEVYKREELIPFTGAGLAFINAGAYFNYKGNYAKAIEYNLTGQSIFKKLENKRLYRLSYLTLGENYKDAGDIDSMFTCFSKYYKLAIEHGSFEGIDVYYRELLNFYEVKGDWEKYKEINRDYIRDSRKRYDAGLKSNILRHGAFNNISSYLANEQYFDLLVSALEGDASFIVRERSSKVKKKVNLHLVMSFSGQSGYTKIETVSESIEVVESVVSIDRLKASKAFNEKFFEVNRAIWVNLRFLTAIQKDGMVQLKAFNKVWECKCSDREFTKLKKRVKADVTIQHLLGTK